MKNPVYLYLLALAASFIVRPSASRRRTSRCRGVRCLSRFTRRSRRKRSNAICGAPEVILDVPFSTFLIARISFLPAGLFRGNPETHSCGAAAATSNPISDRENDLLRMSAGVLLAGHRHPAFPCLRSQD